MRKSVFPYAAALVAAAFALVACETKTNNSSAKVSNDDTTMNETPPSRAFNFTYEVTVPVPEGTSELAVWIPLPQDDPRVQKVDNLTINIPGHRVTTDPIYGNPMAYVQVANPSGPMKMSWSADITRWEDRGQGTLPMNAHYLKANSKIPVDGKALAMARDLGALDDSTPLEKRAKAIYDDVLNGMEYNKKVPGYGAGDFERAVTVCKGNCTDFHARFIGIGRAAKIPVRFTMGIPMKAGKTSYNSYHCWAHWHDGSNWRPVDISEADKVADKDPAKAEWFFGHLGESRVALTFGRDITLAPPQKGEKLNYFVFPYAEADGKPVKMGKSDWEFRWSDL